MEVIKEAIVNKPIQEVWEVLGNQYAAADQWASGLYRSEGYGEPELPGAPFSNRNCDTSFGNIQEEIRTFNTDEHVLEYAVIKGFPGFIKSGVNKWTLSTVGTDRTRVTIHFKGVTQGFLGKIMGPMMGMKLNSTLTESLDDFRQYVETGNPSARKLKDMKKHKK